MSSAGLDLAHNPITSVTLTSPAKTTQKDTAQFECHKETTSQKIAVLLEIAH